MGPPNASPTAPASRQPRKRSSVLIIDNPPYGCGGATVTGLAHTAVMRSIASAGIHWIAIAVVGVALWLLGHRSDPDTSEDPTDPDASDKDGFIAADKYGYGYGYSWGDPFGDPDL